MRELTRRQVLLILAGILAVTTLAIGVYGLLRGPNRQNRAAPAPATAISVSPRSTNPSAGDVAARPGALLHTDNPIAYARAVANAVFNWDTASGHLPTDYTGPVLADADPSGEETPGLITDVATYLPTTEQWLNLAAMDVAQTITIDSASVPDDWPAILQQSDGQIRPGTAAVTITGTRHRTGTWNSQPATSSYPVSFTVFVACRPAFDRCHVLRFSQLNDPLK